MTKESNPKFTRFASKAVHSGTNHVGDAVNTPIFQSSTYKLTDERYAGWAAGAHHALLYTRITSVNAEAVIDKICALEGAYLVDYSLSVNRSNSGIQECVMGSCSPSGITLIG